MKKLTTLTLMILFAHNVIGQIRNDGKTTAKLDTLGNIVVLTLPDGSIHDVLREEKGKSYFMDKNKEGGEWKHYFIRREDISSYPIQLLPIAKN